MNVTLRCQHCDDVIGVYEPMIVLTDGRVHKTSRAAEPEARVPVGEYYHRGCFSQAQAEGALSE